MQQLLFEGNELNSYNYKKFVKFDANTRELIIPENISKIDDKSFENNNLIEGVIFEGDEITVGNFAFNGCKKLNRVVFKCKTLHIEKCAFARCKSLEEIDLSGASEIGEMAFSYCSKLKSVKLSDSLKYINKCAFAFCDGLESISLPDSVEVVNDGTFLNCINLANVRLPEKLSVIPQAMFLNCHSLAEIRIPETVTAIGAYAFQRCHSLKEIIIPESTELIEEEAFKDCKSLFDVTICGSLKKIGMNIFGDICELNIHLTPNSKCEHLADNNTSLKRVTISGEGARISDCMFHHCENLETVEIAEGITGIGSGAFDCCYQLSEISIPDSVKEIGYLAFAFCFELEKVTLPKELKTIEEHVFASCIRLNNVVIPNTVEIIKSSAFYGCKRLCKISIPDSIQVIEKDAFAFCPISEKINDENVRSDSDFDEEDEVFENVCFEEENKMYAKKICVIGVGGIGVTAVTNMAKTIRSDEYTSVEFMAADYPSNFIAYDADNVNICILGLNNTLSDSERSSIIEFIDNADMLYVCTHLGDTTNKAAQIICELAKKRGIFTICAYTMPFEFEDNEAVQIAKEQREVFNKKTDAMIEVVTPTVIRYWDITLFFNNIDNRFRELIKMTPDLNCENYYVEMEFDKFQEMLCGVKNARFITENIQGNYTKTLSERLSEIIPKTTQSAIIHFCVPTDFTLIEYNELYNCLDKALDEKTKVQSSMSFSEDGKNSVSVIEAD